ncbi:MAG: RDD family protein [Fuerstiella sp.]|nr:RDD family protein [Fuerstiella sp.]MCP4513334.1 RDD family protein [Fuerstiella sp.]
MPDTLKVDTRVTVETPEGVDFQFMIAGPGKRGMSFIVDIMLKLGIIAACLLILSMMSALSFQVSGVGAGILLVTWFAMSWLYGSCFEAFWNGQTPGKKYQNLRVVRTNGTPIGWFEAFGRNLLIVADGMLVLGPLALNTVGLLSMASTRRMQRLGDLVFDTMVIDEAREFISRAAGITHGVERLRRSECNGQFHVPERTLAVVERLFEGDRLISDGRREEIARTLSLALRSRLDFVEPGPDPLNPNTYFVQTPLKHTTFLKRVLKTFSDSPNGRAAQTEDDGDDASLEIIDETLHSMNVSDSGPESPADAGPAESAEGATLVTGADWQQPASGDGSTS